MRVLMSGPLMAALLGSVGCGASAYRTFFKETPLGHMSEARQVCPHDGEPEIVDGDRLEDDAARMLENGYQMVGKVFFEGPEEGAGVIRQIARERRAAVAIVYRRLSGSDTYSVKTRQHVFAGGHPGHPRRRLQRSVELYEQGATFWATTSTTPPFGALVLTQSLEGFERAEASEAATVKAVVKDSAADRCGVRRGDVLISLNGRPVGDVSSYMTSLESLVGQAIAVEVQRDGRMVLSCQIAPPRPRPCRSSGS